jgi:antitoxin protein of toxin-antitoxin system
MGILDKLKHGKDQVLQNEGDTGLDKAGQLLNDKTGGKYSDQIDSGVNKVEQMLDKDTQDGSAPTDDTQQQPPVS